MRTIEFGDTSEKAEVGDIVKLQNQDQEVVSCQETGVSMLNIDAYQLQLGDLKFIKGLGLTISNPDTDEPIALGVDVDEETFGSRVRDYFASTSSDDDEEDDDDDDDSSLFSDGGFGSSFGGFGGGSFAGGGASSGF